MNTLRMLVFLLAVGVPSVDGFVPKIKQSKALKPDHLRYIAVEQPAIHESSVVLPNSQENHTRQRWTEKGVVKSRKTVTSKERIAPSTDRHEINNRHSSSDWLYNLKTLPHSSVLKEVTNPVLTLTGWATFISVVHKILLLKGKTQLAANMSIPMVAHSLLVSSLGLLLVFRTNSSYQRFLNLTDSAIPLSPQEGRKIWERILTTSRNLSRFATLYREDVGAQSLTRMKKLIASFPYLLRHHIRSGCLCSTEPTSLDHYFKLRLQDAPASCVDTRYEGDKTCGGRYSTEQEQMKVELSKCFVDRRDLPWRLLDDPDRDTLLKVARSTNRPLWVCDRLGTEIAKIPYTENFSSRERLSLLKSVDDLAATIGQCERIRQTAVPLNYARHALRSLSLWLCTLPFCMVGDLGLLTGPATAAIAWVLFGVYQIGYSIEDPFQKSLRLSILCDAIRRDVLGNDVDVSSRDSAFYFEDEDEDEVTELHEPHSLKGLNGKPGDFLDEADVGAFVRPPSIIQQQLINSVNVDRRKIGRSTMIAIDKSLRP